MTSLRERQRPGGFILSEADGFRSRTTMAIAANQVLDAGTVLQAGDDGLVPFDAGTCAGILIGAADTRAGAIRAAVLSREAEVIFDELVYPAGKSATTFGALQALGIIGRGVVGLDTGGGGGGYVAKAVHVDTGTYLVNPSLVATGDDTGYLSFVYWFKMSDADFANSGVIWVQDPEHFYPSNAYFSESGGAGFIHLQACGPQDQNCLAAVIGAGPTDVGAGKTAVPMDAWVPLLVSFNTNLSPTSAMVVQAYLGDTPVAYASGNGVSTYNNLAPFLMQWNGLSMHFFDDGNPAAVSGDFADIWFAPGQFVDFSIEANRRKFIDASGKPVDLGANGESPTGVSPAVFFSGDHSGFATNRGTGGAFTLTGTLANATTSPSD